MLAGCTGKPKAEVSIDYGDSTIYTKEDMDAAIAMIRKEFDTWDGCELHSISYGSDDACSADNIAWMNELEAANDAQETFSQCILFWQWWLARSEGGAWKLMTWGYG